MPRIKISRTFVPSEWTYRQETLADGSVMIHFDNGMIVKAPPLPGMETLTCAARSMCGINYQILDRVASEKQTKER